MVQYNYKKEGELREKTKFGKKILEKNINDKHL